MAREYSDADKEAADREMAAMGMKRWIVNVEGFTVTAPDYEQAMDIAELSCERFQYITDVHEDFGYCVECQEYGCKDNPHA